MAAPIRRRRIAAVPNEWASKGAVKKSIWRRPNRRRKIDCVRIDGGRKGGPTVNCKKTNKIHCLFQFSPLFSRCPFSAYLACQCLFLWFLCLFSVFRRAPLSPTVYLAPTIQRRLFSQPFIVPPSIWRRLFGRAFCLAALYSALPFVHRQLGHRLKGQPPFGVTPFWAPYASFRGPAVSPGAA